MLRVRGNKAWKIATVRAAKKPSARAAGAVRISILGRRSILLPETRTELMEAKSILRCAAYDARNAQHNKDGVSEVAVATLMQLPEYQAAKTALWYLDCRSELRTRHALPPQFRILKTDRASDPVISHTVNSPFKTRVCCFAGGFAGLAVADNLRPTGGQKTVN